MLSVISYFQESCHLQLQCKLNECLTAHYKNYWIANGKLTIGWGGSRPCKRVAAVHWWQVASPPPPLGCPLVINCTFGIVLNFCDNFYFNTLTLASLVCLCRGSNRLVSWQVLCASLRVISPQTQARRACQLDPKHSRFRDRTCSDNSGFLVSFGQE